MSRKHRASTVPCLEIARWRFWVVRREYRIRCFDPRRPATFALYALLFIVSGGGNTQCH
ncbi:hypothetical protein BQ8482_90180 [Mesorhizobium delmotii]|uniref:Uncharacterized protein n=1 Tax=Mesorhizobium delmotii TaxID=1631247 RepID=A0A2P9AXA2_9HYPH|nr:hypothetical protein BQ8482_90180 [Mesorhizobium delmotii]